MLQATSIPFDRVQGLSKTDLAYIREDPALGPFISSWPSADGVAELIAAKNNQNQDRALLVSVLERQMTGIELHPRAAANIQALRDPKAFCVITAHQPALFTGPLYLPYKILSVIALCRQWQQRYPDLKFIPVYISGDEDHDLEELNHARVFRHSFLWEPGERGPVGDMSTRGLLPLLEQLELISENAAFGKQVIGQVRDAYTRHPYFREAHLQLIQNLFGHYGLVCASMSEPEWKRAFLPVLEDELFHQRSYGLVQESIDRLEDLGFPRQAGPRQINLFYCKPGIRERVVATEEGFALANGSERWTSNEMRRHLEEFPGHFSPNVVLRPLYQQWIFPCLAYIGGGGEIAYWLERKQQFAHYGVPFPLLVRRASALVIDSHASRKLAKWGIPQELFLSPATAWERAWMESAGTPEPTLEAEKIELKRIYGRVIEQAKRSDATLEGKALAEWSRVQDGLKNLEDRMRRSHRLLHENGLSQLQAVYAKFFPEGKLQERVDNYLSYCMNWGPAFFETVLEGLKEEVTQFLLIRESPDQAA